MELTFNPVTQFTIHPHFLVANRNFITIAVKRDQSCSRRHLVKPAIQKPRVIEIKLFGITDLVIDPVTGIPVFVKRVIEIKMVKLTKIQLRKIAPKESQVR